MKKKFLSDDLCQNADVKLGEHRKRESGALILRNFSDAVLLILPPNLITFTRTDYLFYDGNPVGKDASDTKMVTKRSEKYDWFLPRCSFTLDATPLSHRMFLLRVTCTPYCRARMHRVAEEPKGSAQMSVKFRSESHSSGAACISGRANSLWGVFLFVLPFEQILDIETCTLRRSSRIRIRAIYRAIFHVFFFLFLFSIKIRIKFFDAFQFNLINSVGTRCDPNGKKSKSIN